MLEFENTILINRPCHEVFTFLADFENLSKWNYYVLKVEKVGDGIDKIGATYHQVRKNDEQYFQITEYEQDERLAIKTLPQSNPQLAMRFLLRQDGAGTYLIDEWQLETGQPSLLEKLAAGRIQSAAAENLEKLKTLLEDGQVELQDGRVERIEEI